jgi:hypothetical protein
LSLPVSVCRVLGPSRYRADDPSFALVWQCHVFGKSGDDAQSGRLYHAPRLTAGGYQIAPAHVRIRPLRAFAGLSVTALSVHPR